MLFVGNFKEQRPMERLKWAWRDELVGKVLAILALGPECDAQHPCENQGERGQVGGRDGRRHRLAACVVKYTIQLV